MSVLWQMVLIAAVIGTSVTVTATEHVDVWLVLSGTLGWSFVPVLQLLTGLVLARGVRLNKGTTLHLYFTTHWPWSLWILTAHAALLMVPSLRGHPFYLALTAFVPVVVTIRLLLTLCSGPLGLPRGAARRRVAEHQLLTLLIVVLYIQFATALWPRIAGVVW